MAMALIMIVIMARTTMSANLTGLHHHGRKRNAVARPERQCDVTHLTRHHGFTQPHQHQMKAAWLQHHRAASRNRDASFALTHLHHIAVHQHLVKLHTAGKVGRCRYQRVIRLPVIGDGQVPTCGFHARRSGTDLQLLDFEASRKCRNSEQQHQPCYDGKQSGHRRISLWQSASGARDVDGGKVGDGGHTKLPHHITKLIEQNFTGMFAALLAKRGHGIEEGTADQNKIGT